MEQRNVKYSGGIDSSYPVNVVLLWKHSVYAVEESELVYMK